MQNSPPDNQAVPMRTLQWWRSAWVVLPCVALAELLVLQIGLVRTEKLLPPGMAVVVSPGDARANAAMASVLITSDSRGDGKARALEYVQSALRKDPTNAEAVRDAALLADASNDVTRARQTMMFAESLSRRDVPSQLWLLENAVNRGDVRAALDHFDIALRTSNAISSVLTPILVRAIDEPPLAQAIVSVLARRPSWGEGYLITVAQTGENNAKVGDLFLELAKAGVPVPIYIRDTLIRRFVDRGDFARGMKLYRTFYRSTGGGFVENGGFERTDANVAFEWQPIDTPGISTQRVSEGGNVLLEIQGSRDVAGPAIRQMIMLPAGRYAIGGTFRPAVLPISSLPYFELSCAGQQPNVLGRVVFAAGKFQGAAVIPANGCPAQWLTLSVRALENSDGIAGMLDDVAVERIE